MRNGPTEIENQSNPEEETNQRNRAITNAHNANQDRQSQEDQARLERERLVDHYKEFFAKHYFVAGFYKTALGNDQLADEFKRMMTHQPAQLAWHYIGLLIPRISITLGKLLGEILRTPWDMLNDDDPALTVIQRKFIKGIRLGFDMIRGEDYQQTWDAISEALGMKQEHGHDKRQDTAAAADAQAAASAANRPTNTSGGP